MAKESSFDVVSTVDMQEVDNAYGQAKREIAQRYDLKDSGAEITLDKGGRKLTVAAPAEFVAKQVIDVIGSKLIKRGVDLSAVKWGDIVPLDRAFVALPRLSKASTRKPRVKSRRTFVARSSSAKSLLRATSCAFLRLRATRCKKLLPF